ncbi:protein SRG1 isoform X3 [Arachis ipaensis]|uniref:protein SRG1 isoform X3 n=1 Tax=Arachis ipaensis TaxID=130454 RepID=UPI000A2B64AC|nr:protein SRG1 isoform X3 [Arachis ipaensis]
MSFNPDNEMEEPLTFGSSIAVPNVQEMVKNNPLEVPQRYIRSTEEMEKVNYLTHLSSQIPVLDFALLSSGNSLELLKLDKACKDWGFFQLVNHGIEKEVLQRMKEATTKFFDLPIEEKEKYAMPPNDVHGYGHAYVVSEDQILDWSDLMFLLIYPTRCRRLQCWPKTPKGFNEIIEAYSREVNRVSRELLSTLSAIMGMENHVLHELHKEIIQGLRMNYYPPCITPENVLGVSPHSDSGTITLLLQNDDVCGLEIRHKGGWVPVVPKSDALVVNVGDILELSCTGSPDGTNHRDWM